MTWCTLGNTKFESDGPSNPRYEYTFEVSLLEAEQYADRESYCFRALGYLSVRADTYCEAWKVISDLVDVGEEPGSGITLEIVRDRLTNMVCFSSELDDDEDDDSDEIWEKINNSSDSG